MTPAKTSIPHEYSVEQALKELAAADMSKGNSEARRNLFMKTYKALNVADRQELCNKTSELIYQKFTHSQRIDSIVHLFVAALAIERDWDGTHVLLSSLVSHTSGAELFREISLILLEITDNELTDKHTRIPLAQTALVLLTELGLLLASRAGQSSLEHRDIARVVEYITTNLLARSNVNNNAMRISLVHYLARCPLNSQGTLQLNRVISRFGQSLLDDLLLAFFEDKRRGNAAFFFLAEHLNSFFSSTPALAEMSHNVLKHYMLRFPTEFPLFLAAYAEYLNREEVSLKLASKHISLLLRAAIDVSQKSLSESISRILIKHLSLFKDVSLDSFKEQVGLSLQLLSGNSRTTRNSVLEDFTKEARIMLELVQGQQSGKIVSIGKAKKVKEQPIKIAKIGEKPSPLESLLQLAS